MIRAAVLSLVVLAACGGGHDVRSSSAAPADTLLPRDAALERFRGGLAPVESLAPVAAHRDTLVLRFVRALEAADTAALGDLLVTRPEFAYLVYPASPQGLPPYDLSADLMWDLLSRQSERGLSRLLRDVGGHSLAYIGYQCPGEPQLEGRNRIWGPCTITRLRTPGDTLTARLTGPIIERDGRFKFVSYTSDE